MSRRRRPEHGDDHAEKRLGHRRQHAEHRRHHATKGDGCLLVFDANGKLAATWTGPDINDPWGNMAVVDAADSATLFISMSGFDVPELAGHANRLLDIRWW